MQSVMGSRRPNCIIVDEIDGTAGAPGLLPIRLLRRPQSHDFGYLLNLPRCDLSAMRLVVILSKTTVQCSRCDRTSLLLQAATTRRTPSRRYSSWCTAAQVDCRVNLLCADSCCAAF